MKLTPWMLTVSAFTLIAVLAVGFIFKKLTAQQEVVLPEPSPRTLPMAITEIAAGTKITRAHVGNGPWRSDADLAPDTMTSADGIVGRVAKERIPAAQPLRGSQFYAPGEYPDLDVAAGMRAVTINVGDDTAMVNGLIKPGQYVDVHLTVNQTSNGNTPTRQRDGAMTVTLFEGVRVVAMNRSYTQVDNPGRNNVTLELNKEQARILLLGSQRGTIALTYNPEGPGQMTQTAGASSDRVTLEQILGLEEPEEQEKPYRTENYRGLGHNDVYFEDGRRATGYGGGGGNIGNGVPVHGNGYGGNDWMTSRDVEEPEDRKPAQKTSRVSSR